MGRAWRTVEQGASRVVGTWIWAHIIVGVLVRVRFFEKNNRIGNIVRGRCAAKISGFVQLELL